MPDALTPEVDFEAVSEEGEEISCFVLFASVEFPVCHFLLLCFECLVFFPKLKIAHHILAPVLLGT